MLASAQVCHLAALLIRLMLAFSLGNMCPGMVSHKCLLMSETLTHG